MDDRYEELLAKASSPSGPPRHALRARRRGLARETRSAFRLPPPEEPGRDEERSALTGLAKDLRHGFRLLRSTRVRSRRGPVAGARDRREHGELSASRRRPPPDGARRRAAQLANGHRGQPARPQPEDSVGDFPAPTPSGTGPRRAAGVFGHRGLELRAVEPHPRRRGPLRRSLWVSGSFFDTVGVRPLRGRSSRSRTTGPAARLPGWSSANDSGAGSSARGAPSWANRSASRDIRSRSWG